MKFNRIISFLSLICLSEIIICLKDDPIIYDVLEYMGAKTYTLNATVKTESTHYIQMEVDKILTDSCLMVIHQTDPQEITLEYKFEKEGKTSNFETIERWQTINHGSKHDLDYDFDKPKEKGYTLYMRVTVKNYKDKQTIIVESTDSQFNFYILIGIIVAASCVIVFLVILLSYYYIYKSKPNLNDPNSLDVVFAKVGPEDY